MAIPAAKPSAPSPAPAVAAAPSVAPAKKFNWLMVTIPGLVLALVGVGVAFELWRAKMESLQQGQGGEQRLGIGGPIGRGDRRGSREVQVGQPPAPAPVVEEEEITGLGKKKKPPPPKPVAAATPVDRAWRTVKGSYDRLEGHNETTARKYRMRMTVLEDRKASAPEASFVREASALEEELRVELAKPENQ